MSLPRLTLLAAVCAACALPAARGAPVMARATSLRWLVS